MGWREMFEYAKENPQVGTPQDATPHIAAKVMNKKQENFVVVTLNGAHRIIKTHIVTVGLLNKTIVHPREVFSLAIKDNAASIIIGHNHPSGNTTPSPEDREVTHRLKEAGAIMGINVLDHIIVSKTEFYSFLEHEELL